MQHNEDPGSNAVYPRPRRTPKRRWVLYDASRARKRAGEPALDVQRTSRSRQRAWDRGEWSGSARFRQFGRVRDRFREAGSWFAHELPANIEPERLADLPRAVTPTPVAPEIRVPTPVRALFGLSPSPPPPRTPTPPPSYPAVVPPERQWETHYRTESKGRQYFVCHATKTTSWTLPSDGVCVTAGHDARGNWIGPRPVPVAVPPPPPVRPRTPPVTVVSPLREPAVCNCCLGLGRLRLGKCDDVAFSMRGIRSDWVRCTVCSRCTWLVLRREKTGPGVAGWIAPPSSIEVVPPVAGSTLPSGPRRCIYCQKLKPVNRDSICQSCFMSQDSLSSAPSGAPKCGSCSQVLVDGYCDGVGKYCRRRAGGG